MLIFISPNTKHKAHVSCSNNFCFGVWNKNKNVFVWQYDVRLPPISAWSLEKKKTSIFSFILSPFVLHRESICPFQKSLSDSSNLNFVIENSPPSSIVQCSHSNNRVPHSIPLHRHEHFSVFSTWFFFFVLLFFLK